MRSLSIGSKRKHYTDYFSETIQKSWNFLLKRKNHSAFNLWTLKAKVGKLLRNSVSFHHFLEDIMRYWMGLTFILVFAVALSGCPGKNSPSAPAGPAGTATPIGPTPTPTATGVFTWNSAQVYRLNNLGTVSQQANITLQINGAASASVTVVLSGSNISSPVTLPYSTNVLLSGKTYSSYFTNTGFTYTPGQTYTLSTYYGGNSASITLTAPGGITNAADGSQASWTNSGTQNSVQVTNSSSSVVYSSNSATITSPYSIPVSAYGSGGVFNLSTECDSSTSNVSGATPAFFIVSDTLTTSVTANAFTPTRTASSTPTGTPTSTPTLTASSTPTLTASKTPTFTITSSPTLTATDTPTPTCNSTCNTFTPTSTWSPTSSPTKSPTSTPTNSVTATPSSTPTLTTTNTPYPTPAFSTSWSDNYMGQLSATSFSGGLLYGGIDNLYWLFGWSNLTGGSANVYNNQGTGNGQFNSPNGIATDTVGDIFIADKTNNSVQQLNSLQQWQWTIGGTAAGSGVSQFNAPRALVFDGAGHLFVADTGNGRIVELNANSGAWITAWNGSASNAATYLGSPYYVTYDPANNVLYVADPVDSQSKGGIFKYSTAGSFLNFWQGTIPGGTTPLNPFGAAVNASGTRVYVTDAQNEYVEMFDASGNYLTGWGGVGTGNYQFGTSNPSPEGIAVDSAGKVYVSDPGNDILKVYTGTP
jgi:sugar lactone lactonase YvrE